MGDISSANAVYMLSITSIFPVPIQLQGFTADDIFDTDEIEPTETIMGVDGILSAGMTFREIPQSIHLQADSASNALFDLWYQTQQTSRATLSAQGVVVLQGINTKWTLTNGFLRRYKPLPDARKVLQPRRYGLVWQTVFAQPT